MQWQKISGKGFSLCFWWSSGSPVSPFVKKTTTTLHRKWNKMGIKWEREREKEYKKGIQPDSFNFSTLSCCLFRFLTLITTIIILSKRRSSSSTAKSFSFEPFYFCLCPKNRTWVITVGIRIVFSFVARRQREITYLMLCRFNKTPITIRYFLLQFAPLFLWM